MDLLNWYKLWKVCECKNFCLFFLSYNLTNLKFTKYDLLYHNFNVILYQVSACAFNKGKLRVLATATDAQCGGRDIDMALAEYFAQDIMTRLKLDATKNQRYKESNWLILHFQCITGFVIWIYMIFQGFLPPASRGRKTKEANVSQQHQTAPPCRVFHRGKRRLWRNATCANGGDLCWYIHSGGKNFEGYFA